MGHLCRIHITFLFALFDLRFVDLMFNRTFFVGPGIFNLCLITVSYADCVYLLVPRQNNYNLGFVNQSVALLWDHLTRGCIVQS